MRKLICAVAAAIVALFFGVEGSAQAGWSDIPSSLSSASSSIVVEVKKHKDDDDNDGHGKSKKKASDTSGLSECTIQEPGSGSGCKGGFKRVCQKMKSGKKCCGCVPDGKGTSAGKSTPPGSQSGGVKPVEAPNGDSLLLPYCDLNNPDKACELCKK